MSSVFTCPRCHQTIAADVPVGTQVQCPLCSNIVIVPPTVSPVGGAAGFGPLNSAGPVMLGYGGSQGVPRTNGVAIAALICGIPGAIGCIPVGLAAVVLGIIGIVQCSRAPGTLRGRGMAIAGLCLGAVGMIVMPAILLPSLSRARELARRSACQANLRGIGAALQIYASANGGAFPETETQWPARLSGDTSATEYVCPSDRSGGGLSYHYVPGFKSTDDPRQVLAFEDGTTHGNQGGNVLFLDGHASFEKQPQLQRMISALKYPDGEPYQPNAR